MYLIGFDVLIYLSEIWCENEYRSFSDGSELWDDIASWKNKDGAGKFYGKLNNIEKQLVDSKIHFMRIHQSYPVNYRFICKISFSHFTLRDGTVLQTSEDRQKKIMEQYNDLLYLWGIR